MKKITLLILSLGLCFAGWSQTLNQNAAWPNTNWSVTGTFNTDPLAFESDPTLTANFAFDDDDAGSGSDDQIAAESPTIDLTAAFTAGETWVTISGNFVYNYNTDDILQFEYWDADASTWNIIGTPFNADTAGAPTNNFCAGTTEAYTTDVLNIAGFTPTQLSGFRYRIYFDDLVGGPGWEWGFCFDAPTISSAAPPSCADPSALTASNITDTTADLAWTENGSATAWDVEIVTTGTAASGTPTATGVSNPYTATMLAANTEYDYYVRANCGVNGTSAWIGPLTFRTACSAIVAPYTENFDNAGAIPACWNQGVANSENWLFADGTAFEPAHGGNNGAIVDHTSGTGFFAWVNDSSPHNTGTSLESALVDLSGLTSPALSFWINSDREDSTNVQFSVDFWDGAAWNIGVYTSNSNTNGWSQGVVDLSVYTITGPVQARFVVDENNGTDFDDDFALDDVSFDEAPTCFAPTNVVVTATSIDGATIDFTNANTSTNTNVEYGAPGFVQGTGTPVSYTTIPFTLTGLMSGTTYDFYLQSDCGMGDLTAWVGPFSFTTDCIAVADFNENFDGVATPNLPNCWDSFSTVLATGTQPYVQTSTLADETAPNGVRLYSGSSTGNIGSGTTNEGETILISPELNNLSAGTHRLRFFADAGTATSTLEVGTITDPTDPSTFTSLTAIAPTTTHSEFIVNFDSYAGTDQYVALRHIFAGTFDSMYLDNIVWEAIPACPDTSNLTLVTNTDVTATINFDSGNATSAGNYEYSLTTVAGTPPAVSGSWSDVAGANPNVTYTITGLTAATEYFVHVREVCAVGDESVWSSVPLNFTTACSAIASPYTEDFEMFTTSTSAFASGNCWTGTGGAYFWESAPGTDNGSGGTGPDPSITTGNYFYTEASAGSPGDTTDLVSPLVDLTALTAPSLSFNYHMFGADIGTLDVLVNGATNVWTLSGQQQTTATTPWELAIVDLTAYAGQTISITFRATSAGTFEGDIAIDNVAFDELPSCIDVSAVTVDSVTTNSATLSWTENNTPAGTAWEVVAVPAGGPAPVPGTSNATTNPYTITSLTANTSYDVYVRADCSTAFVGPISLTTSCAIVTTYPYTTDFTNNVPNACWDEAGSGEIVDGPMTVGSSDWRANRSYENFAGTVIPSNAINLFSGNTDREWLLSEQYDMTGTSNDVLSIEVAVTNWTSSGASNATDTDTMGSDDRVALLITTDAGVTWTPLMTWTAANQPAVDGTREFIDLSSYTGTVQFAFFASDGAVNDIEDYDFHVGMFIIDGTAGNEDVFASTLSLYPNPVNGDVVTINMGQTSASSVEVAVFNTLGQQVMTRSFDQVNNTINIDNISSLSQGMYFVKLSSGTQQATLKFIKE